MLVADLSDGLPDVDCYGVLAQYPGSSGRVRDLATARGSGEDAWGRVRCRSRPAGPHDPHPARRARGRRRRRIEPALRGAARFRRPARGLPRGPVRPRAIDARPPRRGERRRRRSAGVPVGPADPRAAHPAREGHVEHLHGPGAPGRDGGDVRRLARPRRAAPDRRAHAPARRAAGRGTARRGPHDGVAVRLRHGPGARPRPGRGGRRGGAHPRARAAAGRRRHRRRLVRRDHDARRCRRLSGRPSA